MSSIQNVDHRLCSDGIRRKCVYPVLPLHSSVITVFMQDLNQASLLGPRLQMALEKRHLACRVTSGS